jgi:hypothetical protein
MITVTDSHGPRLTRIAPTIVRAALAEELEYGAEVIAEDAAESIRDGAVSGNGHVASLPGEAPNADTGDLDRSIHPMELIETEIEVRTGVEATSDHAWIERGGANMEARPYLVPATERHRSEILRALSGRFNELLSG